uniref:uncharacterized protein LOC122580389 n=1 Tax=Erigeron canadensis TaxID=72917 RepID=UPI001CB918E8|nr:uncharacterized protein LOC122580389 [Erigeron canadensis]
MKTHTEPTLPVLPRLDRLDRLLELLEEKHSKSARFGSTTKADDDHNYNGDGDYKERKRDNMNCRTLLSALDDVHHKGTLIDRLGMLENRVLQLSMDLEHGSISRSSSSTTYATKEDKERTSDTCTLNSNGKRKRRVHFKWIGWFAMRC